MARVAMQMPLAASFLIVILLAACTVGPDFQVPPPPEVKLTPDSLPLYVSAGRKVQRLVHGSDVRGDWWRLFHSKELSVLIERALRDNHDLKAAQAALRVAHANYRAQQGALFPLVAANVSPTDQKVATSVLSSPTISGDPFYTLQTGQLTISYVPDVFGGIRRQVEAAGAQEESQRFVLEATYLTLTSNIALAAIQEASLRGQIEANKLAAEDEVLLFGNDKSRKAFCGAKPRDWAALKSAIAQAQQSVPLLQKQLVAQRDLLTALTGHFAGDGLREHFTLSSLSLPKDVPVMLSSQIVQQRPDVRAAQANLHAAGALVGVAIANRLPQFNITGNIGRSGSQFNDLLNPAPPFLFWTVAGNVTQTIFDGFTLEQRQRAAEAGWDQVREQYQSTLVTAFQNVADALQAIKLDATSVDKAINAETAARENLCLTADAFVGYNGNPEQPELARVKRNHRLEERITNAFMCWRGKVCQNAVKGLKRERAGEANRWCDAVKKDAVKSDLDNSDADSSSEAQCKDADSNTDTPSGIDLLTSEQLYLTTKLSRITAEASRYADVVALFQALGGGWWNRIDVEEAPDSGLFAGPRP
jgi:NodT family efflux transporter outer membrane factor (OMF) lipoprotein